MTNDRIIDKIKKLLALAQDPGAAPNEAETAARQAAALMAKHDLDQLDISQDAWDMVELEMPGARPGKKDPKEVPPWIGFMAVGVASFTRTRALKARGYIKFRGPRQDVELSQWMLKALIDLAYNASKGRSISEANAFRNGFAVAIQARLKRMAQDRAEADKDLAQSSGGRNLVAIDQRASIMDKLWGPEGRPGRSNASRSDEGYSAGQSAHIPTNRPVSQGSMLYLT